MDLRQYARAVRRSWAIVIGVTLLGIAIAAAATLAQAPKYVTTTKLFVSTSSAASVADLSTGTSYSQQIARSFAEVVTTKLILRPVIDDLKLDTPVSALTSKVTATASLNTVLLDVTVTDTDPERAARIANSIAAVMIDKVPELAPASTGTDQAPVKLTVAQPAGIPTSPSSPRVPVYLAVGVLLGVAIGVGIAVLRELLDNRIRGEHDVRAVSGAPVLGGIAFDPRAKERPLILQIDPGSPRAESFRTLRTNLQFLDIGATSRTFVVTSSVEGEGKSTTTANLAIALADAGHSVVVVEGDLRQPKIAEYMGIEGAAGVTDVIIGRARVEDVVQPWGRKKLFVLPAGQVPPNPSELLGSAEMRRLIDKLETAFEYVLIDSAPLLPVTDAAVLSKVTSGVLLLAAAGRTQRNALAGSVAALERVGGHLHGIVLTMLPTKGPDAYGHYGYGATGYGVIPQPEPT